jgi:hypothetical protein
VSRPGVTDPDDADLEALEAIASAIEQAQSTIDERTAAATERDEKAKAIRERGSVGFRRCAADLSDEGYRFCSPRNSTDEGPAFTLDEADDLATQIEAMLTP